MARILHTSDILIGEGFAHCHRVADQLRAGRIEMLRSLLGLARKERMDAIVVAGNLWADNRVGQSTVEEVARLLSKSPVPVLLLPGHRDPLTPDSPYQLCADSFEGKVRVLRAREPVALARDTVLYPCPVESRAVSGDPTGWIPERGKERLRVAVACSATNGYQIPARCLDQRDLDYLFAGGSVERQESSVPPLCGSPEPTDFGQDAGLVTLIDLSPEREALMETRRVAELHWVEEQVEVRGAGDIDSLAQRWSKDEERAKTLLRLTLRGQSDSEAAAAAASMFQGLQSKLLFVELRNELVPSGLAFRQPLLRAVMEQLSTTAAATCQHDPRSMVATEPEVAREAMALLSRILQAANHQDIV